MLYINNNLEFQIVRRLHNNQVFIEKVDILYRFYYEIELRKDIECKKYIEHFVSSIFLSGKVFGNSIEKFKEIIKNKKITEAFMNSEEHKSATTESIGYF